MKKKLLDYITRFLLIIAISVALFLIYQIHNLGVLNFTYELLIISTIVVLCAILTILLFYKSKKIKIISLVLLLIFTSSLGYGVVVVSKAKETLAKITASSDTTKIRYSLLTYDDSPKQEHTNIFGMIEIEDLPNIDMKTLANKTFGILEVGNIAHNKDVVAKIREEVNKQVEVKVLFSPDEAYKAFSNKEVDILILNESVRSLFEQDLNAISKTLKVYEYENDRTVIRNEADVTNEPFIVYISGIDTYGPLYYQSRSDVNKIMVVNPLIKKILLIDIPRDYYVPITCIFNNQKDKLTHTGIHGVDCTIETVSSYFDIEINYYTRVNFTSLEKIVDALGGITVNSDFDFVACERTPIHVGDNFLNGAEALDFARDRHSFEDEDAQRIKNQSKVLEGIIDKVTSPAIITKYLDFMDVMAETVETNMTNEEILKLIKMQLNDGASWSIETFSVEGVGTMDYSADMGRDLYVVHPDLNTVEKAKQKIDAFMKEYY